MTQNTLIDNSTEELSMVNAIKRHIGNSDCNEIMIATGYWDLPGMVLILDELNIFLKTNNNKLRILIGKEPMVRTYQQNAPKANRDKFPSEYIKKDINELDLKEEYQNAVALLLEYCSPSNDNSQIEIKIYGQGENEVFLHAKCYIFKGTKTAYGIIGSSNFTGKGLKDNSELNYIETQAQIVSCENPNYKGHIGWFNEKWNKSTEWNKIFLEEILRPSPIGKRVIAKRKKEVAEVVSLTPHDVYIKHLQNIWGDVVDDWHLEMDNFMPLDESFKHLQYQTEAVSQGISIMKKHGGFILADVVGLGKTMVGAMLIKRFLMQEAIDTNRPKSVLIVSPPAIKQNWIETIDYFDNGRDFKIKNHVKFITTGSIGNLVDSDNDDISDSDDIIDKFDTSTKYGLILVDESHKFRNSNTEMYKSLEELIHSNTPTPFIVLLSATPQNNKPDDLKNQIYLFQHNRHNTTLDTIQDRKLDKYFSQINKEYSELIKSTNTRGIKKSLEEKRTDMLRLIEISNDLREKIITPLVVRRTRTDLKLHYENDSKDLKFPVILGPTELPYEMNEQVAALFYESLEVIAPKVEQGYQFDQEGALGFYRYRAIEFLINDSDKKLYENKNRVEATAIRLARIMQMLLVKRLESSFAAFRQSLKNMQQYCQNMIDMMEDDCVFICPDIDVNTELSPENRKVFGKEGCYKIIRQKLALKGENNKEFKRSDIQVDYLELLKTDKKLIDNLLTRWEKERTDPKLNRFLKYLDGKFFDPEKNNPQSKNDRKLVIFSESIDTVNELEYQIKEWDKAYKVLKVTSKNRKELQDVIQANFDANYKGIKKNDYNIILTTDVLAEGINLHRSNTILNYDTPWNATRLMQRIGRVNRIGSQANFVYVYNFFPSAQGDLQIDLVKKALTKIQAFHSLFGEDSQVFSNDEEVVNHPLTKGGFDESESPSAKYISALRQFKTEHPIEYERILNYASEVKAARKGEEEAILIHIKSANQDGLFYKTSNTSCKQISSIEMAEALQCDKNEQSTTFPSNYKEQESLAIISFSDYIKNVGSFMSRDETRSLGRARELVISRIKEKDTPEQLKDALIKARHLIEQGNIKLINAIIKLEEELKNSLFADVEYRNLFLQEHLTKHLKSLEDINSTSSNKTHVALTLATTES